MAQVGVRELKAHLSDYLARARSGESVVVTDRGKPIARLMPLPGEGSVQRTLRALVDEGSVAWAGGKPEGLADGVAPRPRAEATVSDDVVRQRDAQERQP